MPLPLTAYTGTLDIRVPSINANKSYLIENESPDSTDFPKFKILETQCW